MKTQMYKTIVKAIFTSDSVKQMKPTDFLFCSSDADKTDVIAGKHVDRILDPLKLQIQRLGYTFLSLSLPYSEISKQSCLYWSHSINRMFFRGAFLYKFFNKQNPHIDFSISIFRNVLSRTKPKAIFCIDTPAALCIAARELEIPIVEVLHGIGYRRVLDTWSRRSLDNLPTSIIAFDSISTKTFSEYFDGAIPVFQLEQHWNLQFINTVYEVLGVPTTKSSEVLNNKQHHVLFSMQFGNIENLEIIDSSENSAGLLIPDNVLRAVELTAGQVQWHFRLHPTQLHSVRHRKFRKKLEEALSPFENAEWQYSSRIPLPVLLSTITHHITLMSMLSYQAAEKGIPSLLMSPTLLPGSINSELFQDLFIEGKAKYLACDADSRQVIEWINSVEKVHFLNAQSNPQTIQDVISNFK
ncbi:hypothetical protein [Aurantimicrobium minutum]|uniref:hypothetical protein n=1 Tax=Aurantimicrobium minutum TaxID=708131 RepID=UPI002475A06C|nr:hypothetical protein [Aurantimicrobium minutum]MDH6256027.1 hypothetical protein [Aurantimicrobium minutum]